MLTEKTLCWQVQSDARRQVHARLIEHVPGSGWEPHRHDYIECFCVDAGSLVHQWEGQEQHLVPGDLVALVPGEWHAGMAGPAGVRIMNVSCAAASLRWMRQRAAGLTTPWDGTPDQRLRIIGSHDRDMLRSIVSTIDADKGLSRDLILLALCQVVSRGNGFQRLPHWLERALCDHVDAGDAGGVQALARRCGMSREHMSRQVRRQTGGSAARLLKDRRLEQAALIIRNSDVNLSSVVSQVGFASTSAFYAGFKEKYGVSPAFYRRRIAPYPGL